MILMKTYTPKPGYTHASFYVYPYWVSLQHSRNSASKGDLLIGEFNRIDFIEFYNRILGLPHSEIKTYALI